MSGKNERPEGHWIKRPKRTSRIGNAPPPREKPGFWQAVLAISVGLVIGLLGASYAAQAGLREGVPGLALGGGLCLGTVVVWRLFGGTLQDFRDLFR